MQLYGLLNHRLLNHRLHLVYTWILCDVTFLLFILMTWDFFHFKEEILRRYQSQCTRPSRNTQKNVKHIRKRWTMKPLFHIWGTSSRHATYPKSQRHLCLKKTSIYLNTWQFGNAWAWILSFKIGNLKKWQLRIFILRNLHKVLQKMLRFPCVFFTIQRSIQLSRKKWVKFVELSCLQKGVCI